MKKINILAISIGLIFFGGAASASFAACVADECSTNVTNIVKNDVTTNNTNIVTTVFSEASAADALRLKSVYVEAGVVTQNNSGNVASGGNHDYLITTGRGNVQIDTTAIGNNFSSELVGTRSANLTVVQKNSGDVTTVERVTHPNVGGNIEISSTAIGNNASIGWDLTTDKNPSNDNFAIKKDGPLRSYDAIGSLSLTLAQCNTGNISASTTYMQDPAANIKVSTTAIGNNMSFGVKTR